MLRREAIEGLRRSLVAGGLPRDQCEALIATTMELLDQQDKVRGILAELGPSWRGARKALNELAKTVEQGP